MSEHKNILGPLPLLVLPSVVLFPGADMPLYIEQPHYEKMLNEILKGDRTLAVTLRRHKWDNWGDEEGQLAGIHSVGCLARVISHKNLPGGGSNIYLRGLQRVELVDELDTSPVRRVYYDPMEEKINSVDYIYLAEERESIIRLFFEASIQGLLGPLPEGAIDRISSVSLDNFVPLVSVLIRLSPSERQQLLEDEPLLRIRRLHEKFRERLLYSTTLGNLNPLTAEDFTH